MTVHLLQFCRNCRNSRIILKMISFCLAPARASMPTTCDLVLREVPAISIIQPTLLLNTKAVKA